MCSIRATLKPGAGTSTTKHDRRRWRGASGSGSVTAKTVMQVRDRAVADEPLRARDDVVVPVADGPGPDRGRRPSRPRPRSARTRSAARPDASRGSQRVCCSGVPARTIGSDASSWTARISPVVAQARLSCSIARQTVSRSRAEAAVARRERQAPGCPARRGAARRSSREFAGLVDLRGPRRDALVGQDRGRRRAGASAPRSVGRWAASTRSPRAS